MTTATLDDVSRWTERDSFFFYFAETAKTAGRHVATWLFLPFCIVGAVVLAQFYPFRILKLVKKLNARLPDVTDPAELTFVRDLLKLTLGAATFYKHFCVFQPSAQEAVWELSEVIDSLELVVNHRQELKGFVK